MALKRSIKKADYDKLSEEIKKEYKLDGEEAHLDIDGDEDIGALKRAKMRESTKRKELEQELDRLQDEFDSYVGEGGSKIKDVKLLDKNWEEKYNTLNQEWETKFNSLQSETDKNLIDAKTIEIANKLSAKNSVVLQPHVRQHLIVDRSSGKAEVKIKDETGKPSAKTFEQLHNDFVANKDFSGIIAKNESSGTGGKAPHSFTPSPSGGNGDKPVDLSRVSPTDLAAQITARKAEANQ